MFKLPIIALFTAIAIIGAISFSFSSHAIEGTLESKGNDIMTSKPIDHPYATFAGGCFWCIESEFRSLDGVLFTVVGYTNGDTDNPSYQDITTGKTGHAEALQVYYDPEEISFEDLTRFFLTKAHDPTQLNRQGVDVGTQYRSEIFYHTNEERDIAERLIKETDAQKVYSDKIVTKVSAADTFWVGEDYHQQYYEKWEQQKGEIHPRVFFKKKMKLLKGK